MLKPKAVKRAGGPRAGPFNRKNFRVRSFLFPARLNPGFFDPDRASPRLTGGPEFYFIFLVFSFLLIMKNTFNFNTNHDFFTSFLR